MKDQLVLNKEKSVNQYLVFSLILCVLVGVHFEGLLAIPAEFLRDGARLKIADLLSLLILGIIFIRTLFIGKVNHHYALFAGVMLWLFLSSLLGPATNRGYLFFSFAWMLISFSTAFFLVDYLSRFSNHKLLRLLDRYIIIMTALYLLIFVDYLYIFFTGSSLLPPTMDYRFHQHYMNRFPRFEGFSVLSLGFVALGYFNLMIAVLLQRKLIALFYLLLIMLSISTGGYIALVLAFTFYIINRMNLASRVLSFLPLAAAGLLIMLILIAEKQATGAVWSFGVRRDFYLLLPQILLKDPLGMGFGQSRYLYHFIDRYAIHDFPILYQKLVIEKLVVVESSHLELWYEFGITGILFTLAYTAYLLFLCVRSLVIKNRLIAGLTSVMLFFWIHGFFTAAYFYQLKFWLINLLLAMMIHKAMYRAPKPNVTI